MFLFFVLAFIVYVNVFLFVVIWICKLPKRSAGMQRRRRSCISHTLYFPSIYCCFWLKSWTDLILPRNEPCTVYDQFGLLLAHKTAKCRTPWNAISRKLNPFWLYHFAMLIDSNNGDHDDADVGELKWGVEVLYSSWLNTSQCHPASPHSCELCISAQN